MTEVYFDSEEREEYEISAEILTLDGENYAALCEQAGVPAGSNILINHYAYNDDGRKASLEPFLFEKEDLRLIKADGSVSEIPVHGELTRMLNFESLICAAKSLTIGLPVAIALTYLINLPIRSAFPIPYRFPWLAVTYCVFAVFAITRITMRHSAFRLRDDNTIEAIRSESWR
jgi:hypothetical protein